MLAALLFGASTPLIARAGDGLGSFWVAALLYVGAAAAGALSWRPAASEARVRLGDAPRLMAMALCGATLAPVLFVWGLARTSATSASLLLALEACFTVLLARAFYAEHLGGRVLAALALLTAGGALLIADQARAGVGAQWQGALAVLGATVLWGLDNTLSRARSPNATPGRSSWPNRYWARRLRLPWRRGSACHPRRRAPASPCS